MLSARFPLDTQMQSLWLPAIRAQLALNGKNPAEALRVLQTVESPMEYGTILLTNNPSCLYPTCTKAQAYVASGQTTDTATEFQKIIDHAGMVWNCSTGALPQRYRFITNDAVAPKFSVRRRGLEA